MLDVPFRLQIHEFLLVTSILPSNIISKYQDDRDNEYGPIQYKRKHFMAVGLEGLKGDLS
jgi:hypothetical protein